MMRRHKCNISIVGAGISGLTAAYRLQQAGYNVDVYEARQRPGGRILSVKMGESYEELGGTNFLDGGDPPVHSLNLINELKLQTLEYEKPFSWAYVNADQITSYLDILQQFTQPHDLWGILEEIASRSQNLQEVINIFFENKPDLRIFFTRAMISWEGSDPSTLDPSCIDSLHQILSNSLKRAEELDEGKTVNVKWLSLKGGNAQLPLVLSEKLEGKIQYGEVLTAVRRQQEKIVLTFNENQEVITDVLLLTMPCGAFQDIEFEPGIMSDDQLNHIRNIQYGTNAKILVPLKIRKKTYEAVFLHNFLSWLNEDDRVMTLYMGGREGLIDFKQAQLLLEQGVSLVKKLYDDAEIDVQGLEDGKDLQFASYDGAVFKSWGNDAFAKGSYSTRGIGQAEILNEMSQIKGEMVRTLFRPIQDQIFFAGEHTTTLPAMGTLEGAIESGERMARLILKSLV